MHNLKHLLTAGAFFLLCIGYIPAQTLKIHYSLSEAQAEDTIITDETGNGYDAMLKGSAKIDNRSYQGIAETVVKLGAFKGYIDMGEKTGELVGTLGDFSVAIKMYIPGTLNKLTDEGNFFWSFACNNDISQFSTGYMGLSGKLTTYTASAGDEAEAVSVSMGKTASLSKWTTVVFVQQDYHVRLYIDGVLIGSGETKIRPKELGKTQYNSIGRPLSSASQNYLKYCDIREFRLYDGALTTRQVAELCDIPYHEDATTLKLHYDFTDVIDKAGYAGNGTLSGGATLSQIDGLPVLCLNDNNGYFDMGSKAGEIIGALDSFTVSAYVYVPDGNLGSAGNFIFNFANSDNISNDPAGYLFFGANESRYSITPDDYRNEETLSLQTPFPTGSWRHLAYTQTRGIGSIYLDGEWVKSDSIRTTPRELGKTEYNFIGRSCYRGDRYLKGAMYSDFRIYDGALPDEGIYAAGTCLDRLNSILYAEQLAEAKEALTLEGTDKVNQNLTLPTTTVNGISISWSSSDEGVITAQGVITRPAQGEPDAKVLLTATLAKKHKRESKEFEVTVLSKQDGRGCVQTDLALLTLSDDSDNLRSDLKLPTATLEGSVLTWKSDDTDYLSHSGLLRKLSPKGSGKHPVTLTVTAYKEGYSESRDFPIQIAEEDENCAYLFAYFTGNRQSQEQIRFALSMNGYDYIPLNEGEPVLSADTIARKKAVRDPHILRGEDGKTFYMVVTDMRSGDGWSSNDGLVLLKSDDLINWTHAAIDFPDTWPDLFDRDDLTQVWAPQTIYDPSADKYMVYYSIGMKGQANYIIWYSYVNEDFTELSEPKILFDLGANTIDADIVYHNGLYHMFFKTEGEGNGIQKATAPTLQGPWTPTHTYLQQTDLAVEGSGVFKLINSDQWVLMYDCYTSGFYQFCSSADLEKFTYVCNTATSGTFTPRHGTVMPITADEAVRLTEKWPSSALKNTPSGAGNRYIRQANMKISTSDKTIYLPLRSGADLTRFNPKLYGFAGTKVTPQGEQDFSKGAVDYTFSMSGKNDVTYSVTAQIAVNPILPDFHADPEVLYSKKTGKFYIYSTTDGFSGWAGTYFQCFSSANLTDWALEGTVIDLATTQVAWASGNAWAPAIEEKMIDGEYRYFFYFSGNAGSNKQIGVATASSPSGPFTDHGSSIVATSPTGGGQQIDVDVFTDPVSGKSYLYWGNGYMAVAELNDDMVSLKSGTTKVITPSGGTLSTYAYREAPYVFYRNGLYYFMWSVDDTGSPNYHVAYGTSVSPLGPIKVASKPVVLIQDATHEIYGTAHNSILQIPGRDEWYVVYHRINKNYLSNGPGYHRETCINRLYFNEDGTIQPVTPTHEGVEPVDAIEIILPVSPVTLQADGNAQVVDTVYYNMSGNCIGQSLPINGKGLFLKKELLADGRSTVTKIVRP